jgi:hypothetical protein
VCGVRDRAVWETDGHEPEGEVPIGGLDEPVDVGRVRVAEDGLEVSEAGGPYRPWSEAIPHVQAQTSTGTDNGGDLSCSIPEVHVKPGQGGGAGPPEGWPKVKPGIGGAETRPPSPQVNPGAGGDVHMDPTKVSKDDGTTWVGRAVALDDADVHLQGCLPKGFAHLGEVAAQLGVDPLRKDGRAHFVMSCEDGVEYDVWEVLGALLAKLREFPKLPDVVRQLDHATEEAIRRQGHLDSANEQVEQLRVQLAGCLMAAEGAIDETQLAHPGDFGWSKAYQATIDLQKSYLEALDELLAMRAELENFGVDLRRGELAVDGVRAVIQMLQVRQKKQTDQAIVDQAVKTAINLKEQKTEVLMLSAARVIHAALESQSGDARMAAERIVREHETWHILTELVRLEKDGICPACLGKAGPSRTTEGSKCCWIDCNGNYAGGCYHCHGATNMPLSRARELLLNRKEKQYGDGGDGTIVGGSSDDEGGKV